MAKLLFKKGNFRILCDDPGSLSASETNSLIKTAATTSHQSRETSKKTPEEFIKMLQNWGHFSALEHSWYTFGINSFNSLDWEIIGYRLYDANNLFCITKRQNSLLVSGNSRMFNEAYLGGNEEAKKISGALLWQLYQENPVLFSEPKKEDRINPLLILVRNPELISKKEILVHRAMTVEFNNCCRGFTHEDVRSRNGRKQIASYTQESTRYVDYAKGDVNLDEFQIKFVLPYIDNFDLGQTVSFAVDGKKYIFTPQQFTNLIEGWYRAIRRLGLKAEEARQWLPIGIKSQIVQTLNLNERRHWFFIRCNKEAHREIRTIAVGLLGECQKRFFGIFDDFVIARDSRSAKFIGKNKLV